MTKSLIEYVVGNLDEKREWRAFMKRVNALPKDYRYAYKKILRYFYNFSCNLTMLTDLLELFEVSAAEGKAVLEIVGDDVASFCDGVIKAFDDNKMDARKKLNYEIQEHFYGKGEARG